MGRMLRVAQVGLGALGRALTPYLLDRQSLSVVGAVDSDPSLVGRDLGDVAGLERELGVVVRETIVESLAKGDADVAILTTASELLAVEPDIKALVNVGANVVSSCEELSYPWRSAPALSRQIDECADAAGVSVLGTGVNPGFLMDFLPLTLSSVCRHVEKVTVLRYQDARFRRLPFQRKIGAGLTLEEFARENASRGLGHVGLTESMLLIAARFGWQLDHTEDTIEPVVAQREVSSTETTVGVGRVAGIHQVGVGYVSGEEKVRLEFRACLGESQPQDTVVIAGQPELRFSCAGGVNGDVATCAILTNMVPVVLHASPGLRTMAEVVSPSWFGV